MVQIIEEVQLDYNDVLMKPKRTTLNSRSEPCVYREYKFKWTDKRIYGNGLMVANMATTGTFEMAKVMAKNLMFCCLQKHYSFEELKSFLEEHKDEMISCDYNGESALVPFLDYIFVSTGIKDGDYEKICKVLDLGLCKNLCIDIANGYIPNLITFVKKIREKYSDLVIMVGNVVTGEMVQDLILSGADIVKCGIGNGSACLTRRKTSIGRPSLSANIECAEAAHCVGGMICADGGCTSAGDICKAYGSGADFVMIGGLVSGADEAEGDVITKVYISKQIEPISVLDITSGKEVDADDVDLSLSQYNIIEKLPIYEIKKFKRFFGMSSELAQKKYWNSMAEYRTSEGREKLVPYVGSVQKIIDDYLGGLRSCMTYIGAKKLKDIPKCCTFYRVNNQLNNIFENQPDI